MEYNAQPSDIAFALLLVILKASIWSQRIKWFLKKIKCKVTQHFDEQQKIGLFQESSLTSFSSLESLRICS